jgi:thiol:disulfide interchange protein DsbD
MLCVGSGWYFLGQKFGQQDQSRKDGISWIPFSKDRLQNELKSGSSVFVDFTADWCITCKFNERTAINTNSVRALLAEKKVIPMKADWTNANPEITAALKEFGRVGVPFYVIYRKDQAPIVLPELLTESILLDALRQLP